MVWNSIRAGVCMFVVLWLFCAMPHLIVFPYQLTAWTASNTCVKIDQLAPWRDSGGPFFTKSNLMVHLLPPVFGFHVVMVKTNIIDLRGLLKNAISLGFCLNLRGGVRRGSECPTPLPCFLLNWSEYSKTSNKEKKFWRKRGGRGVWRFTIFLLNFICKCWHSFCSNVSLYLKWWFMFYFPHNQLFSCMECSRNINLWHFEQQEWDRELKGHFYYQTLSLYYSALGECDMLKFLIVNHPTNPQPSTLNTQS